MLGSSRMYSTPTSCEPIWVANRMRWPSPPERVLAARSRVMYSRPTSRRKPSRSLISLRTGAAIIVWRSPSVRDPTTRRAPAIDKRTMSWILNADPVVTSSILIARHSGFNRPPLQSGQVVEFMNASTQSRILLVFDSA